MRIGRRRPSPSRNACWRRARAELRAEQILQMRPDVQPCCLRRIAARALTQPWPWIRWPKAAAQHQRAAVADCGGRQKLVEAFFSFSISNLVAFVHILVVFQKQVIVVDHRDLAVCYLCRMFLPGATRRVHIKMRNFMHRTFTLTALVTGHLLFEIRKRDVLAQCNDRTAAYNRTC